MTLCRHGLRRLSEGPAANLLVRFTRDESIERHGPRTNLIAPRKAIDVVISLRVTSSLHSHPGATSFFPLVNLTQLNGLNLSFTLFAASGKSTWDGRAY